LIAFLPVSLDHWIVMVVHAIVLFGGLEYGGVVGEFAVPFADIVDNSYLSSFIEEITGIK
jgi:hypothetical protein